MNMNKVNSARISLRVNAAFEHETAWSKVKKKIVFIPTFSLLFFFFLNDCTNLINTNGSTTIGFALRCFVYVFSLIVAVFDYDNDLIMML